jgi:hypothetical protein
MPRTYHVELRLLRGGTWALAAGGMPIAGLTGHDSDRARSWAEHVLKTSHGVVLDSWTYQPETDGTESFHADVTADPNSDREPFTFERGRPRPMVPWTGSDPTG